MSKDPVHPLALFATDSLLSQEDRTIQATVRRFVTERIRPHLGEWYESGQLPARELADWIVAEKLPVRFQMQLHKLLWNDEPGR